MISHEMISEVIDIVSQTGLSDTTISRLREQYTDAHFTYCMDDDINAAKAYRECDGFNVYLVNSKDHCSVLTNDEVSASGLVLAEVIDD